MTVRDWATRTGTQIRRHGVEGATEAAYELYLGGLRRAGRVYNYGTPIFDREWDLLVVLDACRADLLREVVNEYPFLSTETCDSVGSATEEWLAKNFAPAYKRPMSETAYVTGNPHSARGAGFDEERLRHVENVWSHSWSDEDRTVRAEAVTDYAVRVGREVDAERYVVHYMQPHHPFVGRPELNSGIGFRADADYDHVWEKLRRGGVSLAEVWRGYRANLRYVLDSVETLLSNFDAERAVVTADHGNAVGEWGVYGHPMYVPIAALKRVPYCRTRAVDGGTYEPPVEVSRSDGRPTADVEEHLRDLGYA